MVSVKTKPHSRELIFKRRRWSCSNNLSDVQGSHLLIVHISQLVGYLDTLQLPQLNGKRRSTIYCGEKLCLDESRGKAKGTLRALFHLCNSRVEFDEADNKESSTKPHFNWGHLASTIFWRGMCHALATSRSPLVWFKSFVLREVLSERYEVARFSVHFNLWGG